jgi:signal transduction histidine kinase
LNPAADTGGALLARIAHDLRGPLMPLRTAAWLLRNEAGHGGRVGELADIVDRQSAQLARMLDELSDWGRCADRRMALDVVPIEAGLALDLALGALEGDVRIRYADGAEASPLLADRHRLGQLLRTLVEHAAARAPAAPVDVDVAAATDPAQLQLRVRDHGPALEPDARAALLVRPQAVPFDQGLGLRLLMARHVAEAHGGTLAVADGHGDGLCLLLTLPLAD